MNKIKEQFVEWSFIRKFSKDNVYSEYPNLNKSLRFLYEQNRLHITHIANSSSSDGRRYIMLVPSDHGLKDYFKKVLSISNISKIEIEKFMIENI